MSEDLSTAEGAKALMAAVPDLLPIAIILLYWTGCSLLWALTGLPNITITAMLTNAILVVAGLLVSGMAWVLGSLVLHRPGRPVTFLIDRWQSNGIGRGVGRSLPIFLALVLFMPVFSAMKRAIGFYTNFAWDAAFVRADMWIHGEDAWRLLTPLISTPLAMSGLTVLYHLWLSLIYIGLPLICLDHQRPELRSQFILATIMGWIIVGNGLAALFASVGPCFLYPIHGDPHFLPLMHALEGANRHYPVLTLDVQHKLIAMQRAAGNALGAGISAMPSVHVHFALLFALWGAAVSRWVGAAFGLFFVLILVGSVATGYHYAVDGYGAIVATCLIWWFAGKIAWRADVRDKSRGPLVGAQR